MMDTTIIGCLEGLVHQYFIIPLTYTSIKINFKRQKLQFLYEYITISFADSGFFVLTGFYSWCLTNYIL